MSSSSNDDALRPTSVYAYPLTPPMEANPQFADAPTPLAEGGTGLPKAGYQQAGRVKSQAPVNGYRPYHNRFAQHNSVRESELSNGNLQPPSPESPAEPANDSQTSAYPSYYQTLDAAPDLPPGLASKGGKANKWAQQQQLGAAFEQQQQHNGYAYDRPAMTQRSASTPLSATTNNLQGNQHARNVSAEPFSGIVSSGWQQQPAYQSSQQGSPAPSSTARLGPPAPGMGRSASEQSKADALKRSPSKVLASAMAKHKAQREAAGLTTDGEYYVDPKSGKHYFVANTSLSTTKGKSLIPSREDKENLSTGDSGKKGRRKLAKKDSKWEKSQIKPSESPLKVGRQQQQQQSSPSAGGQQQQQRIRSPSKSAFSIHSASENEDGVSGFLKGKIRKPWGKASNASVSSREGTPQSSPQQYQGDRSRYGTPKPVDAVDADDSQEWLGDQSHLATPNASASRSRNGLTPSPGSAVSAYGGMMGNTGASPASLAVPSFSNSRHLNDDQQQQYATSPQQPSFLLSSAPGGRDGSPSLQRPTMHDRSGSLYSNYSYYGLPPSNDGHTASPSRSPSGSPAPGQSAHWDQGSNLGPTRSREGPACNIPMSSPYIAPNEAQFQPGYMGSIPDLPSSQNSGSHSRQPSTTLDKAKAGLQRAGSIQLLAPAKQANLTVPKAGHGAGGKNDALDLSHLDPNDPFACLHLGIDAHEKGQLEESAKLFAKSANGGCGLGMLMYGLSLRHGWVSCLVYPAQKERRLIYFV